MNKQFDLCSRHRLFKAARIIATVSILWAVPLSVHARTDQTKFSAAEGSLTALLPTSCGGSLVLTLTVAALGTTSLQSQGATPVALAEIHGQLCTGDFIDEIGMGAIQFFTVKKAANSTQVPQSITASGQLLMTDSVSGTSETLTFQVTMNAAGPNTNQSAGNSRSTITSGTVSTTTIEHHDINFAQATATVGVSSPKVGNITSTFTDNAEVDDAREHTVQINH